MPCNCAVAGDNLVGAIDARSPQTGGLPRAMPCRGPGRVAFRFAMSPGSSAGCASGIKRRLTGHGPAPRPGVGKLSGIGMPACTTGYCDCAESRAFKNESTLLLSISVAPVSTKVGIGEKESCAQFASSGVSLLWNISSTIFSP